jgi:hypothetical protein
LFNQFDCVGSEAAGGGDLLIEEAEDTMNLTDPYQSARDQDQSLFHDGDDTDARRFG